MGILDRIRFAGRILAGGGETRAASGGQDASYLLDEGRGLEEEGRLDEALERYTEAIRLMPDLARAHFYRGNILLDKGDAPAAQAAYATALAYKPDSAAAHYNMGNAYARMVHHEEALTAYQKAIALKPDFVDAEVAQGGVLEDLGKLDEAAASYRRALEIQPDYAEVYKNLGAVLTRLGQLDDALGCFRRALAIAPDFVEAHTDLGTALKDLGRLDEAVASTRRALEINPDYALAQGNLIFIHSYLAEQSASLLRDEARRYGEIVARQARPATVWGNIPDPARRLRVGLVSADLHQQHPVGNFLEGVLVALFSRAAERLDLFAYTSALCRDEVSARIRSCCRGWHAIEALSDEDLARRIREDGIDILIDLSGHTAHNRLPAFAWKPAPVQVTWLGYLATTGVAAIDYLIADNWTLPETEECYFTEKIWRLPESYLCFTPPNVAMEVSSLPALANGYVTFGSFNNLSKMNDDVVALWARVLTAVPGSRLLLKTFQLKEASARQSVVERFAAHQIEVERLILMEAIPRAEYLAPYRQVDIALDPFPYPGITTTVEALWTGIPVLTLAGERFLSRQGVGLLMNAGLPEWIATDLDDYVARAVAHAGDLQALAAVRAGLRAQVLASPIFDASRFAGHFEAALRCMWQRWCEQNAVPKRATEEVRNGGV